MIRRETVAKTVLTKTRIPGGDYCVNPYVGCEHGCSYCYARFMSRFRAGGERWGEFVDVKVNAAEVLERQLRRARRGRVLLGTVTDPYQPSEKRYQVTRRCLEALLEHQYPVSLLTRSPLCVRDLDLFRRFDDISVGLSIPTDSESIHRLFEPRAPSIQSRVEALRTVGAAGVPTHVFVGPLLPMHPGRLVELVGDTAREVLIDRMNYSDAVRGIYRKAGLEWTLEHSYFARCARELARGFNARGVEVLLLFQ